MSDQESPADVFCKRLKAARELRQWSQVELGKRADLPASSVAHFESGARQPSFDTLRRLAIALDVTSDYLMGRVDSPELSISADPMFRDLEKLSGRDRDLAKDFLKMLANRKPGDGD